MGIVKEIYPVQLFVAALYRKNESFTGILDQICTRFGDVEHEYGPVAFHHSQYYAAEMGDDLVKIYLIFKQYIDRALLPEIKNFTNTIEQTHASDGKRRFNLDPGYIARDKLVLATTKDFYHRLYLSDGIFGEVTLHYRNGKFRHFSWTYPDYKEDAVQKLLEKGRAKLVTYIRKNFAHSA